MLSIPIALRINFSSDLLEFVTLALRLDSLPLGFLAPPFCLSAEVNHSRFQLLPVLAANSMVSLESVSGSCSPISASLPSFSHHAQTVFIGHQPYDTERRRTSRRPG